LLGGEVREVVGDLELADASWEAVAKITWSHSSRVTGSGLCPSSHRVAIQKVNEATDPAQAG
jgi:hypothetical protein